MVESTTTAVRALHSNSLLEPDALTAHQYGRVFRQKAHFEPEERLMFAVLTDAIECFQKFFDAKNRRGQGLFREAEAWIASRDASGLFSFEHVCDALNINASYLRLGLMQWRVTHESRKTCKRLREPLRYHYRVKSRHADKARAS
jgi:hypothetical protein